MAALIVGIVSFLAKTFCGAGNDNKPDPQQQQQGGYPGQQQQSNGYPGQQQQQYQYPPTQQPSYANAAGQAGYSSNYPPLGESGKHNVNQQRPPHQQEQHHQNQNHGYQQNHNQNQNQNQNHNQNHGQGQGQGQKPHYQYEGKHQGGFVGAAPHGPYQNQDQINATNTHYQSLRSRAQLLSSQAHDCFAQSQEAYQNGDGERAHELSERGKGLMREKEGVDDEAEEWIYRENNKHSPPGTIDLHGLYVKEAIERVDKALDEARRDGTDELRIIVGKGIHSQNHTAKIKPAVQDLMRKYALSAHIDPENTGVLIVDLQGRDGGGRSRDAGEVVDEMRGRGSGGGDCVIM